MSDQFAALQARSGRGRLVVSSLLELLQPGLQHGKVQPGVLRTEALTETQQEVNLLLLYPVAPERYKVKESPL